MSLITRKEGTYVKASLGEKEKESTEPGGSRRKQFREIEELQTKTGRKGTKGERKDEQAN